MKKILKFEVKYQQSGEGICGPNAIKHILLNKYQVDVSEKKLIDISNCSQKNGAAVKGIIKVADTFNLNYSAKHKCSIDDLVKSIENNNPAMLLIQAWVDKKSIDWSKINHAGHYIDMVGVDTFKKKVFYYDPLDGKIKNISYEKLDERWHDIDPRSRTFYDHFAIFFRD